MSPSRNQPVNEYSRPQPNVYKKSHLERHETKEIERAVAEGVMTGDYAVIVTDHTKPAEPVAYVNHAFEKLTGYKLAEVIGLHPNFLKANDHQAGVEKLEAAIRAGQACTALLQTQQKNKTPIWYQVNITPVFRADGRLTHFFGSLKDVTPEMDAKELKNDQETFIATVAHDLKTPLVGADRMFALITDGVLGPISPELQATLLMLSNSNKKALALVMNLLENYRLRKGGELLHFETSDLPALIRKTVAEIETGAQPNSSKIQVEIDSDFPDFVFDRLAMSRLLANLLDNAIKYTPEAGPIRISAEYVDSEIVLKVKDTGVGISKEDKNLIFQKYKRCKRQNRFTPGCGLGLFICSEIVKAHHGRISVESEMGVGSTFTVALPLTHVAVCDVGV